LDPSRNMHRPGLVAKVSADFPDDRRHAIARELHAARHVEAVDRLDQPEGAELDEVVERLTAACVARRQRADEWHQLDEGCLPCATVAVAVVGDQQRIDAAGATVAVTRLTVRGRLIARRTSRCRLSLRHRQGHLRSPRTSSSVYPTPPRTNVSSGD